ncbi:hypothetical protein NKR23_g10921 [Pleurostoma richardsiae]|uniref:Uncharacterized protein n=1 Tax=Pleurostoma richardsiae TaxID=41990 RepID=A0AA38VHG7_9PEZI|nr:hypothetical protein NKR23_g10921 [Pleurostoma richardsiae]
MASQHAPSPAKDQAPQHSASTCTTLEGDETITAAISKAVDESIAYWKLRVGRDPQIIKGGGINPNTLRELLMDRFHGEFLVFVSPPSRFLFLLVSPAPDAGGAVGETWAVYPRGGSRDTESAEADIDDGDGILQ